MAETLNVMENVGLIGDHEVIYKWLTHHYHCDCFL